MFEATPVNYEDGKIDMVVEDGESVADIFIKHNGEQTEIGLRLDRKDLVALISAAAGALAALSE